MQFNFLNKNIIGKLITHSNLKMKRVDKNGKKSLLFVTSKNRKNACYNIIYNYIIGWELNELAEVFSLPSRTTFIFRLCGVSKTVKLSI